ncbi:hypothetical protein TIFTF001_009026 [Ficus carica]|uniref:DUF1997 family protein n=1 Tax=Ficus carica TaxID=3494 RepID=A0AA88DHA8_FICCA|nr:hypothetical protein TIFTF001_009026 [Ficus carica]
MILTTKWHGRASFAFSALPVLQPRRKFGVIKVANAIQSESNTKRANLSAAKRERVQLPNYGNEFGSEKFHIGEFLRNQSAIEALLNTNALRSFQSLGTNTYRCTLQRVQLLSFEAAPVLDLRVTPTNEDCTVEMLSCKVNFYPVVRIVERLRAMKSFIGENKAAAEFEGSEIVEQQNSHFSAFMRNHMTWDTNDSESILEVDVMLNLTLEIYTRPFTMMPVSAVERPGNLMLQALLDRLVPLLLQQILQDYGKWVHQQQLDPVP